MAKSENKRNYTQREEAIELRGSILVFIQEGSRTVHEVAQEFKIAYDTALHHMRILVSEEFVTRNERKKVHVYSTEYEGEYVSKAAPDKKPLITEEKLMQNAKDISPAWQLMMGIKPHRVAQ
jgi:predicted transcriptional regulator